jgi:vitamin B12 transporter
MEGVLPDSIVVTASRFPDDARKTGRRVAVYTARDVARLPVASFDELLRTVAGVEVFSRGGFGVQSDITVRGSGFNGVLVLLDGARVNDPMTGHFLTDFPVPLSEIARIEVLRGPATSLYGPDAVGGVVQVFTWTGLASESGLPTALQADIQAGTYGLYSADAAIRFRSGFSLGATLQGSDGMPILDAGGQPMQSSTGSVRTDFRRGAYTVASTQRLGATSLFARAGFDHRDFGAYRFYTPFASDTAREATSTLWAQVRLASALRTRTNYEVHAYGRMHEDEFVYNPITPANRHTSYLSALQALISHDATSRFKVAAGASASARAIDSNNLGNHGDYGLGVFAQGTYNPIAALTLNASARVDHDPGFGTEVTPQVAAALGLGTIVLRTAGGRAVRAPNYVERYYNTAVANPRGDLGNPDLLAERAWSAETGVDWYAAPWLNAHLTTFLRRTDNLIDFSRLSPDESLFFARNIHQVLTRGIETEIEAARSWGDSQARLVLAYTWLDADLRQTPEGAQYKYALKLARHNVQSNLTLTRGRTSGGLQVLYKDPTDSDSYAVFNVRLSQGVIDRLSVTAEVRNLFDTAYNEVFDAPMPGRWWLFGIRTRL